MNPAPESIEASESALPRSERPEQVRPAFEGELAAAGETLARAFAHYPWTRWVLPEDGYSERLLELQTIYLRHAHAHGIVLVADGRGNGCAGVVALLPADAPAPNVDVIDRIVELHGDRIARLAAAQTGASAAESLGVWRLETLGVDPEARGRGIGGELVAEGLREAFARGATSIALETSDARNVELYKRFGFQITSHRAAEPGQVSHAAHGPAHWAMRVPRLAV